MSVAFDIFAKPVVTIPVYVPVLETGPDGLARTVEAVVKVEVEILDTDAIQSIFYPADGVAMENYDAAKLFVTGWSGPKNGGVAAPFNDNNFRAALKRPGFAAALFTAYLSAVNAAPMTREGNSAASPAPSPAAEAGSLPANPSLSGTS